MAETGALSVSQAHPIAAGSDEPLLEVAVAMHQGRGQLLMRLHPVADHRPDFAEAPEQAGRDHRFGCEEAVVGRGFMATGDDRVVELRPGHQPGRRGVEHLADLKAAMQPGEHVHLAGPLHERDRRPVPAEADVLVYALHHDDRVEGLRIVRRKVGDRSIHFQVRLQAVVERHLRMGPAAQPKFDGVEQALRCLAEYRSRQACRPSRIVVSQEDVLPIGGPVVLLVEEKRGDPRHRILFAEHVREPFRCDGFIGDGDVNGFNGPRSARRFGFLGRVQLADLLDQFAHRLPSTAFLYI